MTAVHLSEVVASLSHALDLTGGVRRGHAVRTALVGMRIGEVLGLDAGQRSALLYALLLKDAGCSANAAAMAAYFGADDRQVKADKALVEEDRKLAMLGYVVRNAGSAGGLGMRVRRIAAVLGGAAVDGGAQAALLQLRCERGSDIARMLDLPAETAVAIGCAFEHWDGKGFPAGLRGDEISLLGRIVALAQRVEHFHAVGGPAAARRMVGGRRGRWFDPDVADAFLSIGYDEAFWGLLRREDEATRVLAAMEPEDRVLAATPERLDRLAEAFARVIDAKSPYTASHSQGVAEIAVGVARALGHDAGEVARLRRAALLHDIGKLGVSNVILDKPGPLDADEWVEVRRHPLLTWEILRGVAAFHDIAGIAADHHERLDGSGYARGVDADHLSPLARILAVADVADALGSARPYREALAPDEVLDRMRRDVPHKLCGRAFAALEGTFSAPLAAAA